MKAIQITGPRAVRYGDVPTPTLEPGYVLVRSRAIGICGTDIEIYDGNMPYYTAGMAHYPIIPGHEWAGEIVEMGPGVTGFAVGDHVVGECSIGCGECPRWCGGAYHRCPRRTETGILNRNGAFAEYLTFPATYLHRIDAAVPFETACMIEPTAVAFNGVLKSEVSPEDYVAIYGDGPIGLLVLQVARAFGARRVAMVGATPRRLDAARVMGADAVINIADGDPVEQLRALGPLPDVVIEATGIPDAAGQAIRSARAGGRVMLLGVFAGRPALIDVDAVVLGDLSLRGALGSPHIWPSVIALVESGRVHPEQIITHRIPLADFERGVNLTRERAGIKVIVSQIDEA